MENKKVFDSWFKVNVRPFKQALLNTVCKWGNLFKKHLVDNVINRYDRLIVHMIAFHKSSLVKENLELTHLRFSVLPYYCMVFCCHYKAERKGKKAINPLSPMITTYPTFFKNQ
jgi:hypothetical protein